MAARPASEISAATLATPERAAPGAAEVGVTTSSFERVLNAADPAQRLVLWDLPQVMAGELGLRVIDLNSTSLGSREPAHLERFRSAAAEAGCVITNLKVNERGLPFDARDPAERRAALREYEGWIEAAALLGAKWLRPFPSRERPEWAALVDGYRALADFAGLFGITLLVENFFWLESDPEAIPRLLADLGHRIAAAPDTGNWPDEATRREGLSLAFPHAVTCDFKALELGAQGEHPAFDLFACFQLGQEAGFRGPWCLEHKNSDRKALFAELRFLADRLGQWTLET